MDGGAWWVTVHEVAELDMTAHTHAECGSPGSSVHGTLQVRLVGCGAVPSSRGVSNPGSKPVSLKSPAPAAGLFTASAVWEAHVIPQSRAC